MKVIGFFIQVFSVLVYLTIGSLLLIMSLHIAAMDDILAAVRHVYQSFWGSVQTFGIGFLFICIGLAFAKALIKKGRTEDALVYTSETGRITVPLTAVEDIVRKALKKFLVIKDSKIKPVLHEGELEILMRLTLWSTLNIPDLLRDAQEEVRQKLIRVLGMEYALDIKAEVVKVEGHKVEDDMAMRSTPQNAASSSM